MLRVAFMIIGILGNAEIVTNLYGKYSKLVTKCYNIATKCHNTVPTGHNIPLICHKWIKSNKSNQFMNELQ